MKTSTFFVVALALSGCKNTTDPYLSADVCVQSHMTIMAVPMVHTMPCGKSVCSYTTIQMMPVSICDKREHRVWKNPNYIPPTEK